MLYAFFDQYKKMCYCFITQACKTIELLLEIIYNTVRRMSSVNQSLYLKAIADVLFKPCACVTVCSDSQRTIKMKIVNDDMCYSIRQILKKRQSAIIFIIGTFAKRMDK